MPSAVEVAVDTFIRAAKEPDPDLRAQLLEACFAEDGRMVTPNREIRGRAAINQMLTRAHSDPQFLRIRLLSVVDARSTTFRYRAVVDKRDGTSAEAADTGEIDSSGRISLILTFDGPLADAED